MLEPSIRGSAIRWKYMIPERCLRSWLACWTHLAIVASISTSDRLVSSKPGVSISHTFRSLIVLVAIWISWVPAAQLEGKSFK